MKIPNVLPGPYEFEPMETGHGGSFYEPPDPGHPAAIFADYTDPISHMPYTIEIAQCPNEMTYNVPRNPDDDYDDGVRYAGDPDAQMEFLSLSWEMYQALHVLRNILWNNPKVNSALLNDTDMDEFERYVKARELIDTLDALVKGS